MNFSKKTQAKPEIPTASMPDIIFMLLIFFMVTTVLKQYEGLKVHLPSASKIKKIEGSKRHITTIWINQENKVVVDDVTIKNTTDIRNVVWNKISRDPQLKISLKADKDVQMGIVTDVQQELRKAGALKLVYSAIPE
jgi:biopolymer transport protein ExbD